MAEISLRPITADDAEFLFDVYSSTRVQELELVDWTAEQREQFLRMQFNAQHTQYIRNYAGASFDVILLDGEPVGRLYVERRAEEIRVVDISLLPVARGKGIGTALLQAVLQEAAQADVAVTIHVEMFNPALRLYERLGFERAGDVGVYYFMRCTPRVRRNQPAGATVR